MLEKLSAPGPSAGRGAFLIAGYYNVQLVWPNKYALQIKLQESSRCGRLTDVVLTPHSSNFSKVGAETFGVSINSKSLSATLALGLDAIIPCESQLCPQRKGNGDGKYMGSWTA